MTETLFGGSDEGSGATPSRSGARKPEGAGPLPARARPRSLAELVGQEHLLEAGAPLRIAIEQGQPHSMILYGPPGSGKTTLARILADASNAALTELSAVEAGRAEVRATVDAARTRQETTGGKSLLFLDEIHRFNKAQQDALLPAVESGTVILIGATTENPYFEVNSALLSRTRIYELNPLSAEQLGDVMDRAARAELGGVVVEPAAREQIVRSAAGDARAALGALELAASLSAGGPITPKVAEQATGRSAKIRYDARGEQHYDYTSAWIKSTRGSDPDASVYYLAAMLAGGEDPRFVARRMVILAAEDIGNADPNALLVATAAAAAVDRVGMPECRINLAQAAIYLALAPKSNAAYEAINAAMQHVRTHGPQSPPDAIRSSAYAGAEKLGRGTGYDYPHARSEGVSPQPLLPDSLRDVRFYKPTDKEPELAERFEQIAKLRGELADGDTRQSDELVDRPTTDPGAA